MILNDTQKKICQDKIRNYEDSLKNRIDPMMRIQIESNLLHLNDMLSDYNNLKSSGIEAIKLENAIDFFTLPIKYRLAANMDISTFSKVVKVSEKRLNEYERDAYKNVSGKTFIKVMNKIPLKISGTKFTVK